MKQKQIKSKYMVAVVSNQIKAKVEEAVKPYNSQKGYDVVLRKGYNNTFRYVYVFAKDGVFTSIIIDALTQSVKNFKERYENNVCSGFKRINRDELLSVNPNDIVFYVLVSKTYTPSK